MEEQIRTYVKTHDGPFGYLTWNGLSSDEKDAARELLRDKYKGRFNFTSAESWWNGDLKDPEKGAVWVRIKERAKEMEKRGPRRDYWEGVDRGKMVLARSDPRNAPMDQPVVKSDPKEITNSIGIKLMRIPKGKFMMGSPESEEKRDKNETQHEVTISQNFYMGTTEVTQAQWQKVMGNNSSEFKGDQLPVETVSWEEAVDFCKRLSEMPEEKKAGRKYRLPTEAEWEYACRAGTTTPFHFGSQLNGSQANCDGTVPYGTDTKVPNLDITTPVGKYPANAWGLYDMHGNVWEWCADWYGDYPWGSVTDPSGPATGDPTTGSLRVGRGGCWRNDAVICRSAIRSGFGLSFRYNGLGFRVALSSSGIPE